MFLTQSRSLSTGHIYTFYERLGAVEVTDQPTGFIVPTLERFNPYEGEINPFYYPFDQIKDKSGEYKAYCLSIKDTMNINGKIYNKVAVFYLKGDVIEPVPRNGWPAKYYWTKNYGVIQKDLFEPTFFGDTSALYHSWKLINSNIKQ